VACSNVRSRRSKGVPSLEGGDSDYFDRVREQLERAVDRIDADSESLSNAVQVQLNETIYRLTLVATIFLPLTFLVGFFGMNFTWMVDQIDSAGDFFVLGVAIWLVPLVASLLWLRVHDARRRAAAGS
jgi:Mg2+ and Co2+ transporter CorA